MSKFESGYHPPEDQTTKKYRKELASTLRGIRDKDLGGTERDLARAALEKAKTTEPYRESRREHLEKIKTEIEKIVDRIDSFLQFVRGDLGTKGWEKTDEFEEKDVAYSRNPWTGDETEHKTLAIWKNVWYDKDDWRIEMSDNKGDTSKHMYRVWRRSKQERRNLWDKHPSKDRYTVEFDVTASDEGYTVVVNFRGRGKIATLKFKNGKSRLFRSNKIPATKDLELLKTNLPQ